MSRTDQEAQAELCASSAERRQAQLFDALQRPLTPQLTIRRALPQKGLRMVGPWCFLDHFGPVSPADYADFDVATHPHCGLQTVTWLFSGQLLHHDSLGYQQPLRRGQLNLMTSGHGMSHAEVADRQLTEPLHGLQLWAALPPAWQNGPARFDHYREVPHFALAECTAELLLGEYVDRAHGRRYQSPGICYHPTLAMILKTPRSTVLNLALEHEFEHALYVVSGQVDTLEQRLAPYQILQLGSDRSHVTLELGADTVLLLLGGEPFEQPVRMWWNFVAMDLAALRQAEQQWNIGHARFGDVPSYHGERLLAPHLPDSQTER